MRALQLMFLRLGFVVWWRDLFCCGIGTVSGVSVALGERKLRGIRTVVVNK